MLLFPVALRYNDDRRVKMHPDDRLDHPAMCSPPRQVILYMSRQISEQKISSLNVWMLPSIFFKREAHPEISTGSILPVEYSEPLLFFMVFRLRSGIARLANSGVLCEADDEVSFHRR